MRRILLAIIVILGLWFGGYHAGIVEATVIHTPADTPYFDAGPWVLKPANVVTVVVTPNSTTETQTVEATTVPFTPTADNRITQTAVRETFLTAFNNWREDMGLTKVERDTRLRELGQAHANYMAEHGRLTHRQDAASGTVEERFEAAGLLPECRIDIQGSDRYYPGAENAAQTSVFASIDIGDGTVYYDTPEKLAQGLLRQWRTSPGHRKPMVQPDVSKIGLGVVITEDNDVWAALEMC